MKERKNEGKREERRKKKERNGRERKRREGKKNIVDGWSQVGGGYKCLFNYRCLCKLKYFNIILA